MKRLICLILGHKWRMADIAPELKYDMWCCERCGAKRIKELI
jgi:hypothetical protein